MATHSNKKRVLSGMRSTGKLHLGNYVGALENWVRMQEQYDCFFFIADWHALTTDYADTSRLKENSVEVLLDWLAAGLDPAKCVMFIQSHVPAHAELHLLLSMITPLGWLERVPTYKEQKENIKEKDLGTYGFLGYPVLQSADILIYKADVVPVGEDQVAHVELTREIARRFNVLYPRQDAGAELLQRGVVSPKVLEERLRRVLVFPEPAALLTPAPRLPGTDGRKMSKSYGNAIMLTDPESVVRDKLRTMVNDPSRVYRTDPGNPDVCPVGDLHKIFSTDVVKREVEVGCRTASISCSECKSWAADALVEKMRPMQEKRKLYEDDPRRAWDILEKGSEAARKIAGRTMLEVRRAMGISAEYAPLPSERLKRSLTDSGAGLHVDPLVWDLTGVERGDAIRRKWLDHLPTDIILKDIGSRTYLTSRSKRVGMPTSRENDVNEWMFRSRDRSYDVVVLLCLTKTFEIIDFVLPQKIFQSNWKKFARREGSVIILVVRRGHEFLLTIPGESSLPITEFRSNLKPLI